MLGLIQAAFIILHFFPQAEGNPILYWSWWQILIPTFIGFGIFAAFLVIIIIGFVIAAIWGEAKGRRATKRRQLRLQNRRR